MSDIKAGDLVMVVRPAPCCGDASEIGRVYTVVAVWNPGLVAECANCGASGDPDPVALFNEESGFECARLIRIDPPALPESVETEREVMA